MSHNPFKSTDIIHNATNNKILENKKRKEGPDSKTLAEITALQNVKDFANENNQKSMSDQTENLFNIHNNVELELERIKQEKKKIEKEELERIEEEKKKIEKEVQREESKKKKAKNARWTEDVLAKNAKAKCSAGSSGSSVACNDEREEIRHKIKPSQPFFFDTQQKIDNHEPIEQGFLIAAINRDFANACNFFLSIGAVQTAIKYKDNCLKIVNSFLNPTHTRFKNMKSKIKKLMHECINDIDRWEIWISEIILITPELLKLYNKIKKKNTLCTSEGWLRRSSSQEPTPSESMGESDDGGGSSEPRNKTSDTIFPTGLPRTEAMSYSDREWLHNSKFGDVQLQKHSKTGNIIGMRGQKIAAGQTETVAYNLSLIWFDFNANLDHWMQRNKNTQIATEISTTTAEQIKSVFGQKMNTDDTFETVAQIAEPDWQVTTAAASAKIVINNLAQACVRTDGTSADSITFTREPLDLSISGQWPSITRPDLNKLDRRVLISEGDQYREYILSLESTKVISDTEAEFLSQYADTISQEETRKLANYRYNVLFQKHMKRFRQGRSQEVLEALARQGETDTAAGEKYYYDLIFNNDLLTSIHDWIVMQVWGEVKIRAKKHGTSVSAAPSSPFQPSSSSSSSAANWRQSDDLPLANWRQSIGSSSSAAAVGSSSFQQPSSLAVAASAADLTQQNRKIDSGDEGDDGEMNIGGSQSRKRRQSKKKNQSRKKKKNKNKSKNKKNKSKNKKKQKKSIKKRRY